MAGRKRAAAHNQDYRSRRTEGVDGLAEPRDHRGFFAFASLPFRFATSFFATAFFIVLSACSGPQRASARVSRFPRVPYRDVSIFAVLNRRPGEIKAVVPIQELANGRRITSAHQQIDAGERRVLLEGVEDGLEVLGALRTKHRNCDVSVARIERQRIESDGRSSGRHCCDSALGFCRHDRSWRRHEQAHEG
jgi:hypothetical protein